MRGRALGLGLLGMLLLGSMPLHAASPSSLPVTGALPIPAGAVPGGPSVPVADGGSDAVAAYDGVALLDIASTCSGVLIRPGVGPIPADAPAYVLTNGHCVGLFDATTVIRDQGLVDGAGLGMGLARFGVTASDMPDADLPFASAVRAIRWATMKGTDLAIVELADPLADLVAHGIDGYPLAEAPAVGTPLVVVGGPSALDGSGRILRLAACTAGPATDLFEWRWTWFGFPSNDCADIRPGSSGSPVFDPEAGTLVALVNTTTQGSGDITDCSMGRPCEVSGERLVSVEDAVYGPGVGRLGGCFDTSWGFVGPGPACPLDPGDGLGVQNWTLAANPGATTLSGGFVSPSTWAIDLVPAPGQTTMRLAEGRAGTIDCHDPRVYGEPVEIPDDRLLDPPLPVEEGSHVMCLLGGLGTGTDVTWQSAAFPTVLRAYLDRTPPLPPIELIAHEVEEGWMVEPLYMAPDLSQYDWKWGPADAVDCADPTGYEGYRGFPMLLERADAPIRLCVVGYDDANNASEPLVRVFSDP